MSSEKRAYIDLAAGEKRLLRYTIVALSAVTLVTTIVFIIWVFGQILAALHALVFPLAMAGVLALVLFPVVELFERHLRMNRLGAVVSLFVVMFGLFLSLMVLVLPTAIYQGSQFIQSVPGIAERGHESLSYSFPKAFPIVEDAISRMDIQSMLPDAEEATDRTMKYLGFLVGLGFVPLYLFFALLSGNSLKENIKGMLFLFTDKRQNEVLYLGQVFIDYVTAFFRGQLTIALIMGVMMAIGFTVIGLEAAIYIGLVLGLLNIVPYLGFIVGVVTVMPIAYFQPDGGSQLVMLVLAVIAVTQLVESVLLTPKIMADRSGLHPALVVISILFWGIVLGGVVGMILAVPLTAFLLTLGRHVKSQLPTAIWTDEPERLILTDTFGDNNRQT
ncbi:MAG: AI-2E family transporter [Halomonas sp.]|uniref:AI-2E family transporter n=1 Tax=Halomonas sp. TaxID=1486246 RepID=UPI0019F0ECBF|nr:AI-2E family transporter [Halomonas sp.]MBE0489319.1 AI-2E family transporter [Halomonas sp.]